MEIYHETIVSECGNEYLMTEIIKSREMREADTV